MVTAPEPLEAAVSRFDRVQAGDTVRRYEAQRAELLRRFPFEHWPVMSLEEYALGHEGAEDSYCRWMEFKSLDVGSIRGGTARKLIIYKHKDGPGWFFPRGSRTSRRHGSTCAPTSSRPWTTIVCSGPRRTDIESPFATVPPVRNTPEQLKAHD